MAKTLQQARNELRGKHYKLSSYLKQAAQIKANHISTETPTHLACNIARDTIFTKSMKKDLLILQVPVDLKDILPNKNTAIDKEVLQDIACGRYGKESNHYAHNYEYLHENIIYAISHKKVVFIMFGLESYCIIHSENEKTKRPDLAYSTHSTCLILIPSDDQYEGFYINSHGRDISDTDLYYRIVSSKRTKSVEFEKPAELHLISNLINYWRTLKDYNDNQIKIKWDETKRHTYLGVNLQAGDQHGVCFAYPQIILHNFGETYDIERKFEKEWGNMTIKSTRELLKNGSLDTFVKLAFIEYDSKYDETLVNHMLESAFNDNQNDDKLEEVLEERKTRFTRNMVCSLIRYLSQISFKI
jgi:hypothetical protein